MSMNTINSLRMVLIYAVEFLDIIPDSAKADPDIAAISQMVAAGRRVNIPLGVDWRLLKWQRPEVAA